LKPFAFEFYILLSLTLPFAFIGAFIERIHRILQNKNYDNIITSIGSNKECSLNLKIYKSIFQLMFMNTITFLIGYLSLFYLLSYIDNTLHTIKYNIKINWPLIWSFSFIGGILSLRIKKSYLVFLVVFVLTGFFLFSLK